MCLREFGACGLAAAAAAAQMDREVFAVRAVARRAEVLASTSVQGVGPTTRARVDKCCERRRVQVPPSVPNERWTCEQVLVMFYFGASQCVGHVAAVVHEPPSDRCSRVWDENYRDDLVTE